MWRWDQGHLPYFQFDSIRRIAAFVCAHDFKKATPEELRKATGLSFAAPESHSPWRQYARALKLCLLITTSRNAAAKPTPVAFLLAEPGKVTCDEYLHFLIRSFTDPAPAFQGWEPYSNVRYPLLFALRYLLSKRAMSSTRTTSLAEVLSAYEKSGFTGDESQVEFASLVSQYQSVGTPELTALIDTRQAEESLRVIAQISYLHLDQSEFSVSLDPQDASNIFDEMVPVGGQRAAEQESEIGRIADLFRDGALEDFYDYPNTVITELVESGFVEGTRVQKTHVTIERNRALRDAYFSSNPTATCDVCFLDTAATYQWTSRVLDIHHLLPLASGTRVTQAGTTLEDVVPVCPTCHRAIHRFYDGWLHQRHVLDFSTETEALSVYNELKASFHGAIHV